jgi:hypothetical protein
LTSVKQVAKWMLLVAIGAILADLISRSAVEEVNSS